MVCSCNYFKPEKKAQSIARVGKSYLYKSDIATLVPAGTTKEDSLLLVREIILIYLCMLWFIYYVMLSF
jgi:hypothetical protein